MPDEYTWVVADRGTMTVVSEDAGTRSEDPNEFVDGISHFAIITLEPTKPGTNTVCFELVGAHGGLHESIEIKVVGSG